MAEARNEVLVLGGTGKVGARLVAALRADGARPRPASRRGEVRFDWGDPATWRPALVGADSLFIIGPGSGSDWSPKLEELLQLAADEGVARAVLLSARAVEFLPDGVVAIVERAMQRAPIPWTILRPAHFAQNFTEAMFAPVDGVVTAPAGDGAEPFVDVRDIAEVAAAVLVHGGHDGEAIDLSGPSAVTFAEAVAVLGDVGGRSIAYADEAREDHIAALRAAGTPELYISWRMAMLDAIRSGADAYVSDGVERVLGRPATPFRAWTEREAPRS